MPMKISRLLLLAAAMLGVAVFSTGNPARACPFCTTGRGPTLIDDYNEAKLVVLGTFIESKMEPMGEFEAGTSKFKIAQIFKDHDIRKQEKDEMVITLPIYRKVTDAKFVLFCDVFKGSIDPYRGVQVGSGSELTNYLKGAVQLKDAAVSKRLQYCFDFLNSKDIEVAMDAYREYAKADYADYKDIAANFDADKLVDWLTDPETPPFRYGLYASLLGHCGKAEHLDVLKTMLNDPKKRDSSGIDGMFAGYVFLLHRHNKGKDGLAFLRGILNDTEQEFMMRWTALKTLRFLWDSRPDVFTKTELTDTAVLGMKHKDMADFAIEDLRKWKCWDRTKDVLALFTKNTHKAAVIKRSILRFALQCPNPEAQAFVAEQMKANPTWVSETKELLELEYGSSN
jgi:hypothetical protein